MREAMNLKTVRNGTFRGCKECYWGGEFNGGNHMSIACL